MNNKQIISIDWSKGEDQSVVNNVCGNCGYLLESLRFPKGQETVNFITYKKCPKCGAEFKKHIVIE